MRLCSNGCCRPSSVCSSLACPARSAGRMAGLLKGQGPMYVLIPSVSANGPQCRSQRRAAVTELTTSGMYILESHVGRRILEVARDPFHVRECISCAGLCSVSQSMPKTCHWACRCASVLSSGMSSTSSLGL